MMWPMLASLLCFLILYCFFLKVTAPGAYALDPQDGSGGKGRGVFQPHNSNYMEVAKLIITVGSASIGAIALFFFRNEGLQSHISYPLIFFVASIVYGVFFIGLLVWRYEQYCHDSDSYTRPWYALILSLGFSMLTCFATGYAFFVWILLHTGGSALAQNIAPAWKFAVSGDSRNCGDIVMPAIASGVRNSGAEFYWHLGDFRAIYTFDEDMVPPASLGLPSRPLNIIGYENAAWPDFIAHQMVPFGDLPVFLTPGNHETIPPATRQDYLTQFADWLEAPPIRAQRLKDDPKDHKLRAYYHWISHGVDFIALDNASTDQFDTAQLNWFRSVINRAEAFSDIRTIVVGMHAALPGSVGYNHSMSDWAQGEKSGREVYEALWHAQNSANKRVYVLASHSHFYMEDVYRTDYWKGKVVPGWIVGTAGAVRYRLPPGTDPDHKARADVYGYLIGSVANDGSVSFSFQQLKLEDLIRANQGRFAEPLVTWCYDHNKQ